MAEVLMHHLEYVVALARERHFGRAAAACHVSQPTLSVAIRRVERELGVAIVLRGRRFEGFTDEGRRVVTWAQRILAERDELLADVDRMRGRLNITARIGAIPTAVPASPLLTEQFLSDHPSASVRIEVLPSREIVRRLVDFEIDAGLTYLDDDVPPGSRRVELYREQYVLIAPADDPVLQQQAVAWSDVAGHRTCALTRDMRNRRMIDRNFADQGVHLEPVVEADTVGALFAHISTLRLAAVACTTWLQAYGLPAGMAARPMAEIGPRPAVGLITLNRRPASIVAQALEAAAGRVDFDSLFAG